MTQAGTQQPLPPSRDSSPPIRPRPTPRALAKAVVQLVGFAACIALFWWVIRGVLAPQSREQLERLGDAPAWKVAALLALGLATTVINGAIFQVMLRPVRRLRTADVQSVNAVASMLAPLPFKIGLLFRVFIHNRRDRLSLLTIIAWFGAITATMGAAMLPPLGAAASRGTINWVWAITSIGGVLGMTIAVIVIAQACRDGAGWVRLERFVRALPLPRAIRGTPDGSNAGILPRIHEGLRMLSHPGAVVACVALRLVDAGVHTARFLLAASILGVALPTDKAVIAGVAYFLIGAAAPTGQLGAREAGAAWLLGRLLPGVGLDQFKLVALLVSATEASVLLLMAMAGAAWLRPWRLLATGMRTAESPAAGPPRPIL